MLIIIDVELEIIIIRSFLHMPYHIQSISPASNIAIMPMEMFSAFFSRASLISWGSRDNAVQMLATIPIIVIPFIHVLLVFKQAVKLAW